MITVPSLFSEKSVLLMSLSRFHWETSVGRRLRAEEVESCFLFSPWLFLDFSAQTSIITLFLLCGSGCVAVSQGSLTVMLWHWSHNCPLMINPQYKNLAFAASRRLDPGRRTANLLPHQYTVRHFSGMSSAVYTEDWSLQLGIGTSFSEDHKERIINEVPQSHRF